jgi:IS30 family transposase
MNRRFKSEVHHLKSLTEESSSVKVGYCSKQTDKLMNYSHLSIDQRNHLYQLQQEQKLSQRELAKLIGCSQSTICRELQRNKTEQGWYLPDRAQILTDTRRKESKTTFNNVREWTIKEIKTRLKNYHSPEQIAGRLKTEGEEWVSHETIYQMIYQNYQGLGKYQEYLRQGRKKRKKRGSLKGKRGGIPNRVGIEQRPTIAAEKKEIGHWESDTIIGGNHLGVLVTHVDKASKFLVAGLGKNKTSKQMNEVTEELFKPMDKEKIKTFTCDKGKEFSGHEELSKVLSASFYFATPYHSWERGLNEHTNGLLRQFFPKGTNFKIVKPEEVQKAVELINHRPRKCLDYRTPFEVFYELSSDIDALHF